LRSSEKTRGASQWVKALRGAIRGLEGLTVTNSRGRVRLQYRPTGLSAESTQLPYRWEQDDWSDVALRVRKIAIALSLGTPFREACGDVEAASSKHGEDWDEALASYQQEPQVKRLNPETWKEKHLKAITAAMALLKRKRRPQDGTALMKSVLAKWDESPTMHSHMRRGLTRFLDFCVRDLGFNAKWRPDYVETPKPNNKRKGYPLTDAQILRLIDSMPDTVIGRRYRFAFQLMATYGLRPADLRFLHTRNGGTELWSDYRKSKGGKKGATTEPRRLYALAVLDLDGTPQNWNLVQRVHLGEELPPLGELRETGQRLHIYLKTKPVWQSIKAEAEAERQQATAYSFRHRYAYVSHNRPTQDGRMRGPKQCADAMGHSLEVHQKHYASFMTRDLAQLFDEETEQKARKGQAVIRHK
jgi:hypothetical protein